jgi:Flp pilus assembly protein TadB
MDTALTEAAKQVPSLFVLAGIVVVFLKALDKRDTLFNATTTRALDVINKNTEAATKLSEIVSRCEKNQQG